LLVGLLVLGSCINVNNDDVIGGTPATYKEFHNYPDGRKSSTGLLKIHNSINSPALLFTDSVSPTNYIGTVDSLSDIKVKLPEEKFYTIVAVDKANYEEKKEQAAQYSNLTYHSNSQPYSLSVKTSNTSGGGTWVINNHTNYWVALEKSDRSGIIYAVVSPNAQRATVPISLNENYNYIPHFYKELKYDGRVIALVESFDEASADTARASTAIPRFTTDIGAGKLPSANIKPAVFFTNSSDKTVRVFYGQNNQLSNGAEPGDDFALVSGDSAMFTNGIEVDSHTNNIQFDSIAWNSRKVVTQDMSMQKDKVYRIVLSGPNSNYSTTVEEKNASEYFD
jgi:hypothetical protein